MNQTSCIIILGETGVGKSTFIQASGPTFLQPTVGHDLESCTRTVEEYVCQDPRNSQRSVILIDTPGFDDSDLQTTDDDRLKLVMDWLEKKSRLDTKLRIDGVIYLHDIGKARQIYDQAAMDAKKLSYLPGFCFATTKWKASALSIEMSRQVELHKKLGANVQVGRFDNSPTSAWSLIDQILLNPARVPLSNFQVDLQRICSTRQQINDEEIIVCHSNLFHKLSPIQRPRIMLLGETGVGKSTFINVAGANLKRKPTIGHDIESCTSYVEEYECQDPRDSRRSVILIDTPGFDDSDLQTTDDDQLKLITDWLEKKSRQENDATVDGVIYLHDITKARHLDSPSAMDVKKLSCPPGIFFATTKWQRPALEVEVSRQEKLERKFTNVLEFERFDNTPTSAWNLIDRVTLNPARIPLMNFREDLKKISLARQPGNKKSKRIPWRTAFMYMFGSPKKASKSEV